MLEKYKQFFVDFTFRIRARLFLERNVVTSLDVLIVRTFRTNMGPPYLLSTGVIEAIYAYCLPYYPTRVPYNRKYWLPFIPLISRWVMNQHNFIWRSKMSFIFQKMFCIKKNYINKSLQFPFDRYYNWCLKYSQVYSDWWFEKGGARFGTKDT